MELLGYSERGFLNTFFYECYYSARKESLLRGFLSLANWPCGAAPPVEQAVCRLILMEQSFSDFGDSDAVLAFECNGDRFSIFCEAKRGARGRLATHWKAFTEGYRKGGEVGLSSNLITQLYFKQRLATALHVGEDIRKGLGFDGPLAIANRHRKIGERPVVARAVDRLRPFTTESFFLMVIPCKEASEATQVFAQMQKFSAAPRGWDLTRWGFVTLQDIEAYCKSEGLGHTTAVCEFNRGQLY